MTPPFRSQRRLLCNLSRQIIDCRGVTVSSIIDVISCALSLLLLSVHHHFARQALCHSPPVRQSSTQTGRRLDGRQLRSSGYYYLMKWQSSWLLIMLCFSMLRTISSSHMNWISCLGMSHVVPRWMDVKTLSGFHYSEDGRSPRTLSFSRTGLLTSIHCTRPDTYNTLPSVWHKKRD